MCYEEPLGWSELGEHWSPFGASVGGWGNEYLEIGALEVVSVDSNVLNANCAHLSMLMSFKFKKTWFEGIEVI